jgi:LytR cell envelope-related transcriptional attenuator
VQHAEPIRTSFPWRSATLVVGALAGIELVVLIGIVALNLVPAHAAARTAVPAKAHHVRPIAHAAKKLPAVPSHPLRARARVRVLVLNGNGAQGAASTEAARLQSAGYRIGGAENAQRHDYARSMVLYVPGWVKEARRLAHDAGIRLVAPVDGLSPAKLKASQAVVILGNS